MARRYQLGMSLEYWRVDGAKRNRPAAPYSSGMSASTSPDAMSAM
jgi:hypothetical protein